MKPIEQTAPEHTPMIQEYLQFKQQFPDTLLLYRMGDYYELFFADAVKAAPLLDITLTQRGQLSGKPIAMAGVPFHSVERYVATLVQSGESVALCEIVGQVGDENPMRREVVLVVMPGPALDLESPTSESRSNAHGFTRPSP